MSGGRWRISVTPPDWGQDHLSPDAVVAYADDELAAGPHLRATRHLAQCPECAAQVVAQGQARAALRTAGCPSMPSSLLSSLRSIPQDADLPAPPAGLAVTQDGQFVSVLRPEPAAKPQAGPVARTSPGRRALRLGTGVAVSGLAIGAIAFGLPGASSQPTTVAEDPPGVRGGVATPVEARLQLATVPPTQVSASATPTPVEAAHQGGQPRR